MAWVAFAACRGEGRLYFPTARVLNRSEQQRVWSICFPCPVRRECLSFALIHEEEGVWAGFTRPQRETLRKFVCHDCRFEADPVDLLTGPAHRDCPACRERRTRYSHPKRTSEEVTG